MAKSSQKKILNIAQKNNLIEIENKIVSLNKKGDEFTTKAIEYIITNEDTLIEDMKEDYFLFRG